MRVCVISDTHGNSGAMRLSVRAAGEVECYIHLGDVTGDARALEKLTGKTVFRVRGNCDAVSDEEAERVVTLGGARLFLTHGHRYGVSYGTTQLAYRAEELDCRAALFGHTHMSLVAADGALILINPGSPSLPRGGMKPSIALLEIENGDIYPRIVTL